MHIETATDASALANLQSGTRENHCAYCWERDWRSVPVANESGRRVPASGIADSECPGDRAGTVILGVHKPACWDIRTASVRVMVRGRVWARFLPRTVSRAEVTESPRVLGFGGLPGSPFLKHGEQGAPDHLVERCVARCFSSAAVSRASNACACRWRGRSDHSAKRFDSVGESGRWFWEAKLSSPGGARARRGQQQVDTFGGVGRGFRYALGPGREEGELVAFQGRHGRGGGR